jgi:hypothetical protein
MKKFRDFEDAREFVRKQRLTGVNDWYRFCKSGRRPNNIPSTPDQVYKKVNKWTNWGDFLGTGNVANFNKIYKTFEECKKFAHKLKLKNQKEWFDFCKSGNKPVNIPVNPSGTYKNKGWISWGDFLGNGKIANQNRIYRSFNDAREFVHTLKLKSMDEYRKFCKSGNKPEDIPTGVNIVYKKEWISFGDWLGTGSISSQEKSRQYISYKDAKSFAQSLKLKSKEEWINYCKSSNNLTNIPTNCDQTYRDKGWESWGDFLGNERIVKYTESNTRPFEECKKFVRSLGITSSPEWFKWWKKNKRPDDIPYNPDEVYKEWITWRDFLGPLPTKWKLFEDAREFVHSLNLKSPKEWNEYCKSGNKPENIPAGPFQVYQKKWKGWGDFLNTGNVSAKQKFESRLSFVDAKKYVQKLGFKTGDEFREWAKTKKRPISIPSHPNNTYKKEWTDWYDFLGLKQNRHFKDAKKYALSLNLKYSTDWFKLHKEGKIPNDIPRYVNETYFKKGWKGWGDFLGTGNLSPTDKRKHMMSFEECKKFVRSLGIKTETEWREWLKNNKKPDEIPTGFARTYPDEWISMGDFLGTGVIADKFKRDIWLPLKEGRIEARRIARELKITSLQQWRDAHKAGKIPKNLPLDPKQVYSKPRRKKK